MPPAQLAAFSRRVLKSAMLYALLSTAVRVGANLILIPILVKKLTTPELALWWIFVTLGGFAYLSDFGFGQAISRVYSYLWAGADSIDTEGLRVPPEGADPNRPALRRFNATVRRLYFWLSVAGLVALAAGGSLYLWRSAGASMHRGEFWLAWSFFATSVVYNIGTSHWILACQGINRVRELQFSSLWGGVAYVLAAGTMLLLGFGLWSMVIATALRAWISREICAAAYRVSVPRIQGEILAPDLGILRKIWPNVWKFGLISVAGYAINSAPVLICGFFLGEAATASYGLTSQLGYFLLASSGLWLTVKWPQLTILRTQGKLAEMSTVFAQRLGWAMATFTLGALLLVFCGNWLLELKGSHTRLLATPYLVVFLLFIGQQLFYGQFGLLTFTENVVPFYRLSVFTAIATLVLSSVLTPRYGLWGLVLAPLIAVQLGLSWYPVWRGYRGQPLSTGVLVRAFLFGRKGVTVSPTPDLGSQGTSHGS
jgi:O-antigen/teichoic acid export membrane protein